MSLVKKCDLSGAVDEPVIRTDESVILKGEKVTYTISIECNNGYQPEHVSILYLLNELHTLSVEKINKLRERT